MIGHFDPASPDSFKDLPTLLEQIDIAIIATPHAYLAEYGHECLKRNIPTLIEKPAAISKEQIQSLLQYTPPSKVGYNLRFHPAAQLLKEKLFGQKPIWIRAAYGHGGRPGYEKEWRMSPAGGGESMDQGVHLLDLLPWLTDESFAVLESVEQNQFYTANVDDNCYWTLKAQGGAIAQLHCSANQWKNLFRLEIATSTHLYYWEGLGGSYGIETLTYYQRNPDGGAPLSQAIQFEQANEESWKKEWEYFYECVIQKRRITLSPLRESLAIFDCLQRRSST